MKFEGLEAEQLPVLVFKGIFSSQLSHENVLAIILVEE